MILTFLCVSSAICKHLVECKKWSWSRNKFASIIELQCFDVCRCPNTQMISSSIWRSFWERSLCFHPFWIKFYFLENCQRFLLKISHSLSALCFDGKTYESSSVYYLPGANMFDVCRKYSMNKYKHFSIRNRSLIRPKLIHVCTRNRFFLFLSYFSISIVSIFFDYLYEMISFGQIIHEHVENLYTTPINF